LPFPQPAWPGASDIRGSFHGGGHCNLPLLFRQGPVRSQIYELLQGLRDSGLMEFPNTSTHLQDQLALRFGKSGPTVLTTSRPVRRGRIKTTTGTRVAMTRDLGGAMVEQGMDRRLESKKQREGGLGR